MEESCCRGRHKHPGCSCFPCQRQSEFWSDSMRRELLAPSVSYFFSAFCSVVLFKCLWISSQQEVSVPTQCIIVFASLQFLVSCGNTLNLWLSWKMGAESGPWGCSRKNVSKHSSSSLPYPAAAPGAERVWLTQALPCF